jgi:hypothetical protein
MSENRKSIRILTDAVVDVASDTEVVLFHKIRDLGEGGISLEFPTLEPVGSLVDLSISLPTLDRVLECSGEVVRSILSPMPVLGIRFTGLSEPQVALLRRFLAIRAGNGEGDGEAR